MAWPAFFEVGGLLAADGRAGGRQRFDGVTEGLESGRG